MSDVCLIVDANVAHKFLLQSSAITQWLSRPLGNPRLVAAGKLLRELAANDEVRKKLVELERAGRLRSADAERLHREERRLRAAAVCLSNDTHILALAIVSGTRTLATNDNTLATDFKNKQIIDQPRGRIYRDPTKHAHLLRHTPSCGIAR